MFFCLTISFLLFLSCNAQTNQQNDTIVNKNKTPEEIVSNKFQKAIDTNYLKIEKYYESQKKLKNIHSEKSIEREILKNKMAIDSLLKAYKENLELGLKYYKKQLSYIKQKKILDKKTISNRKKNDQRLNNILTKINQAKQKNKELMNLLKLYKEYRQYKIDYNNSTNIIQNESIKLENGGSFIYNKEKYYYFIVDPKKQNINTFLKPALKNSKNHLSKIKPLKKTLENKGIHPLMITNGGMYEPNGKPVGLLISNGKQLSSLNLKGPNHLNFYLHPNGVFFMKNDSAFIMETNEYDSIYNKKNIIPDIATQSGPMLIINGQHHPKFNHGSKSKKLRSGVGILPNGNIVFIISEKAHTNFFQFATIFKDVFGCNNALFLDGVISEMYIKDIHNCKNGNFGPIIYVTKK